ncbi:MAG: glycerate kinase type-2 family protein [Halobacteriota archaeon]
MTTPRETEPSRRELIRSCLEAGVAAARPATVVPETVTLEGSVLTVLDTEYDLDEYDRVVVLGGGNAASQVAVELESILGDRIDDGLVVTDDPIACDRIDVRSGGHPLPTPEGAENTAELLDRADSADADTLVIGVVTGGASAIVAAPADGISLADLRETTDALLDSGATIDELNAVRKHLSAVKGGRFAAAIAPATACVLVLSDVVGNDLATIGSGPFSPDPTTYADAIDVIETYHLDVPASVLDRLRRGDAGEIDETPGTDASCFDRVRTHVIGESMTAIRAAAACADEAGYEPLVLSSRIRGEAREAAKTHVAIAEECLATGNPASPPIAIVSGGETTVTIRADGLGGPNQEFALSAALELDSNAVAIGAIDTDGIDGPTDAAGAIVDGSTVGSTGIDRRVARRALETNDAYPLFESADALYVCGPTGTNVNDLRVVLVDGSAES